jgi:ATP synthase proteolipid subunit
MCEASILLEVAPNELSLKSAHHISFSSMGPLVGLHVYACALIQIGTWKSGISIVHTGIRHPGSIMKNVIPIVMAGVIGIYGLIVGVILGQAIIAPTNQRHNVYSIYTGLAHLTAGLCCGISGLAAGVCIGIVGDYGIRAVGYRASQITLFPANRTEAAGYATIPDQSTAEARGEERISVDPTIKTNSLSGC